MTRTYLAVFEKGPSNYSGFAPDVPGCISVGNTLDEIYSNFQEALELWISGAVEFGEAIPEPVTRHIVVPLEGEANSRAQYTVDWMTVEIPSATSTRKAA